MKCSCCHWTSSNCKLMFVLKKLRLSVRPTPTPQHGAGQNAKFKAWKRQFTNQRVTSQWVAATWINIAIVMFWELEPENESWLNIWLQHSTITFQYSTLTEMVSEPSSQFFFVTHKLHGIPCFLCREQKRHWSEQMLQQLKTPENCLVQRKLL